MHSKEVFHLGNEFSADFMFLERKVSLNIANTATDCPAIISLDFHGSRFEQSL